jgi:protein tyrosine phosphatase (PTP) superfamily phosphohydrolase (DUF442 family)
VRRARRSAAAIAALIAVVAGCAVQRVNDALPNEVKHGSRLTTAGQPSEAQLHQLRQRGYELVVHIATRSVPAQSGREESIVRSQGLEYIRVRVDPLALGTDDQHRVSRAIEDAETKVTLIHCDFNALASAFLFVHRVVRLHDDPRVARTDWESAGVPPAAVLRFVRQQLYEAGVTLEEL